MSDHTVYDQIKNMLFSNKLLRQIAGQPEPQRSVPVVGDPEYLKKQVEAHMAQQQAAKALATPPPKTVRKAADKTGKK